MTTYMAKNSTTIQVSYRLDRELVERMRDVTERDVWPPPPSQTEIVTKGIELVLKRLEATKRGRVRADANG